ncbi:MAG: hypothetical protein ACHBN1_31130 [Heteroscytonema crispum UTEX LB 1556]
MPAPLSASLRQRVIDAYKAEEGSQRQLADRFLVSLSFIKRLIRRDQDTGQVTPSPQKGGA